MNKPRDPGPARLKTENSFPALGCMDVATPRGPIHVHDMPGFMSMTVQHPNGEKAVGLLVYDPTGKEIGRPAGFIAQLSAANARVMAHSLLTLAAEIDGGRLDS